MAISFGFLEGYSNTECLKLDSWVLPKPVLVPLFPVCGLWNRLRCETERQMGGPVPLHTVSSCSAPSADVVFSHMVKAGSLA